MRTRHDTTDPPADRPELEHFSAQLSTRLAELARTEERAVPAAYAGVEAGERLGRFELRRELGRGGFGVVWEARDLELGRAVALKLVRPGTRIAAHGAAWLRREAEAVARLNHPHIVTLHDVGQGPGGMYLVFELLEGETLAARLARGALAVHEVLRMAAAVAAALVHAHAAGVIHRDLTPGNVHLGADGRVKVLDFGLSHLFGREGASDGGTAAYMAPEQWRGVAGDGRTDLFALGVILHEALAGAPPYRVVDGRSEVLGVAASPRLPRESAPPAVRRLVAQLLEPDPARRPSSAADVEAALRRLGRRRGGPDARRAVAAAVLACGLAALGLARWRARVPPVSELPEAARLYAAGVECVRSAPGIPGAVERCAASFEQALAVDPGLALARFRLAQVWFARDAPASFYRVHLDAALAVVDRMPAREAALVRALEARARGALPEAARRYADLLDDDPADLDALDGALTVSLERGAWADVVPVARKLVELAPQAEDARDALVEGLARTGHLADLRALRDRDWPDRTQRARTNAVVLACLWLGEPGRAVEAARDAARARGGDAELTLVAALSAAGDFDGMEAVARDHVARHPEDPWQAIKVAVALAARGRVRDALAVSDQVLDAVPDPGERAFQDAMFTAATWDARATARAAERALRVDREQPAIVAVPLLLMGDVRGAKAVGDAAPAGSILWQEIQALRAWRAGNADEALAQLAAAEARDPWPNDAVSPALLTAEVASASGDHRAALAAAQRFLRLPARGYWRAWAYPRALLVEARAQAALGRRDEARATLARLLAMWAHADPDHPLLREARALDASLGR